MTQIRVATEADVESLFDIRTSVLENHQSRSDLAHAGVTPQSVAQMLRSSSRAWIASEGRQDVAFSIANAPERPFSPCLCGLTLKAGDWDES